MIKEFVERWEKSKNEIRLELVNKEPEEYLDLVKLVAKYVGGEHCDNVTLDPDNITQIDNGDYQGTLLYVIPQKDYQPRIYYSVFVDYGSCSGCDTLLSLRENYYDDTNPIDGYMTLCLHIVQNLNKIPGSLY